MTLDDKFYPEDGSLLTKFDNYMIKGAGKIGKAYQKLTGQTHKEMVKEVYKKSAYISGVGLVPGLNPAFTLISPAIYSRSLKPDMKTPIEEENSFELAGMNRKYGKIHRTSGTIFAGVITPLAISMLGYEIDSSSIYEIAIKAQAIGLLAIIPCVFGDYLSKANIPKPPKKTVRSKSKRNYNIFAPKPIRVEAD